VAVPLPGDDAGVSLLLVALLLPLGLLALMLGMERVERPLRVDSVSDQLEQFLDSARPEEVETYVSEGYAPALERYWRRRRLSRLLPGRARQSS
jgi:hypothetical protein